VSKTTPTQRSLALLRKQGWTVAVSERWNPHARIRQDLFGFLDLVCIGPTIIGIQTTSGTNVAARVRKILDTPAARQWLEAGARVIVHGWRKLSNGRWDCREVEITREMFQ
jgi:hypothetical protein